MLPAFVWKKGGMECRAVMELVVTPTGELEHSNPIPSPPEKGAKAVGIY